MRRALAICLFLAAAPAQAATAFTDGVWTTTGYGYAFSMSDGQLQRYEITAISCRKSVSAERLVSSDTSARFTGSTVNQDTGVIDAFNFRPGSDLNQLVLNLDGSATEIHLNRADALPTACTQPQPADPVASFDIFARTFAEHYPFFAQHGVDWAAVTATHRAEIGPTTDDQALFAHFRAMLAPLQDAHVWVEAPALGLEFSGWRPPEPKNEATRRRALEIVEKRFLTTPLAWYCNNQIAFGLLPDNIGYLLIASFENYAKDAAGPAQLAALDAALDDIFQKMPALRGLVVDIRPNGGGTEMLGLAITARLTTKPYLASNKIYRTDPADPSRFGQPQPIMVRPSPRPGFYGPMALLMGHESVSAAEAFAMALQGRQTKPIFIGENTQGVFSDVLIRHLPNGWRFGVPNEIYLTERGQAYDIVGVPPDINVPVFADADLQAERDPAITTALRILGRAAH